MKRKSKPMKKLAVMKFSSYYGKGGGLLSGRAGKIITGYMPHKIMREEIIDLATCSSDFIRIDLELLTVAKARIRK